MKRALSAIAIALAASTASAGLIFDRSPSVLATIADDDYGYGGPLLAGVNASLDRTADVTFTAVFAESDYRDYFLSVLNSLFDETNIGDSFTSRFAPGLMPFKFGTINIDTDDAVNGVNGTNFDNGKAQFAFREIGNNRWLIGFNDSYTGDYDFDDLVVSMRIDDVQVPEPLPSMLLGIGLAGIGLTRLWRNGRNKAAKV